MKKKFLLILVFINPFVLTYILLILLNLLEKIPMHTFLNLRYFDSVEYMRNYLYISTILGTYLLYKEELNKNK
ncbi:hypothetical protein BIV18_02480 [Peptoniphilus porci]|uniref:Uncharacterized protein n=1 Tax=Peptoniphilus porci TaxID=2652280 RepID=A0A1U7LYI8_9FIRM|nr:hypothetical protein BIV18_02480 [Peptoniphilus porci]